jgi:hypothetical protein
MFAQARNTVAQAVVRYNKQKQLYKLLVAFNVTERTAQGKLRFPVPAKCAYVSGDFSLEELAAQLQRATKHISSERIIIEE